MEHWLLYTTHREHGGIHIRGIFNSQNQAATFLDEERKAGRIDEYWDIATIENWINDMRFTRN